MIRYKLLAMQDIPYRLFQCKLIPTVDACAVIGIRTPALRTLAKQLSRSEEAASFMNDLPHLYYEENNLHGFLIEQIKDYDQAISALDTFLPYVDNWATCDSMNPKVLAKYPEKLLVKIKEWIASGHTYTVRYAIGLLMKLYLDERFCPEFSDLVASVQSEEYYVRMMVAWYFATALAKQYDAVLPYLTTQRLDIWTHNKAIQKAIESNRIDDSIKQYLRTLKRKD